MAKTSVHQQAQQFDVSTVPIRNVRSLHLSARPKTAGSLLPAVVNLLSADGAASPGRVAAASGGSAKRVNTVMAVPFPASQYPRSTAKGLGAAMHAYGLRMAV